MSDLISRQAAIDALDFEIVHMTAYCDEKNEGNPLAQYNKGLEDGKKQSKHCHPHSRSSGGFHAARGCRTQTEMSFYGSAPVWVLDSGSITVGGVNTGDNIYSAIGEGEAQPIAWMPLPEPYKEGETI